MNAATLFTMAMMAAVPADWHAAAEGSLRADLQGKYPSVAEWKLTELVTEKQRASLYEIEPTQIETRQLGARSAVRLEWTNRAGRREATTIWFAVEGVSPIAV